MGRSQRLCVRLYPSRLALAGERLRMTTQNGMTTYKSVTHPLFNSDSSVVVDL